MRLRPYQSQLKTDVYNAWASGKRNVLAVSATGSGKCLGRGTPVLMIDGTIRAVQDIKPGDRLIGPDSKPRRVLNVCTGREPLYRIVPIKGDAYTVNESHILSLRRTPRRADDRLAGKIVNLSVLEFIASAPHFRHTHKGWRTAVHWQSRGTQPLSLDPYFLGVWLGDGLSKGPSVCTGDIEIKEYLKEFAKEYGMDVRTEANSENSEILHLVAQLGKRHGRGIHANPITNALNDLNVLDNKHVPHRYKIAGKNRRLELLAGIIDTDGYYSRTCYSVTLVNERLLDDVIFVARSLGFAAYKTEVKKTCCNNGKVGVYWSATISGDIERIPCLIARKKAAPRRQKKSVLVTGIRAEPIGVGDYFGFELDGDGLFLLGDFTVTHNTVIFADVIREHQGGSVAIAHRQELVSQISLSLARSGVRHRIIGAQSLPRTCMSIHLAELGRHYFDPSAPCAVAGVDTLARMSAPEPWMQQTTLGVQDEAHHMLTGNKWGKAAELFPFARWLGVTAVPLRADGRGLGRHADGIFDAMVLAPGMRDLIRMGYLTDYRIFAPPSDIDLSNVPTSAGGDFSPEPLRNAVHHSHIVGDVVQQYLKIARGKLGVTFAVDVESATQIAAAYRAAGVPAEIVSAKTPDALRAAILRRFKNRELLQLVNVDLFGEGYDLPAIEVVSMARPTQSFNLFAQQFGRALRLMLSDALLSQWDYYTDAERLAHIAASNKPYALIIDHVSNVHRHGLPDARREWTLDRRERRSRGGIAMVPIRTCPQCASAYEAIYATCPYCGFRIEPAERSMPAQVDGDLWELSADTLARLRGEINTAAELRIPYGAAPEVVGAITRRHREKQEAQAELCRAMQQWGGIRTYAMGETLSQAQRRFYFAFGIDVATAQTLNRADAEALTNKIQGYVHS